MQNLIGNYLESDVLQRLHVNLLTIHYYTSDAIIKLTSNLSHLHHH
jgi:hypothetical protein